MSNIPFADFKAFPPFSFMPDEKTGKDVPKTNKFDSSVDLPRFIALITGNKKAEFKIEGTFVEDANYENTFGFYFKPNDPEVMVNFSNLLEPNSIQPNLIKSSGYDGSFLHRELVNDAGNMKIKLKPNTKVFGKAFNGKALGYEFGAKLKLTVTSGFYFVEGFYGAYFVLNEVNSE